MGALITGAGDDNTQPGAKSSLNNHEESFLHSRPQPGRCHTRCTAQDRCLIPYDLCLPLCRMPAKQKRQLFRRVNFRSKLPVQLHLNRDRFSRILLLALARSVFVQEALPIDSAWGSLQTVPMTPARW